MLYGVLSDIHSNAEALESALALLRAEGARAWICCGDIVGYGPDPDACVERLRGLDPLFAIAGNHDLAALGRLPLDWFNPAARAAALWTGERLAGESRRYLEGLTARLEAPEFTLAHGTPRNPPEEYLLSGAQFSACVPLVRRWPLFVGHTHMPLLFAPGPGGREAPPEFLGDGEALLPRAADGAPAPVALNPGSVGQPRDHDPRASCGLYDSERGAFRVLRAAYDIPAVQEKIRAAGLPESLALRLAYGQ